MDILGMQEFSAKGVDVKTETGKKEKGSEYAGALKKIVGVFLIVVAAAFGRLLTGIPPLVAFAVIFAYIFLQMRIWLS